MQFPYTMQLRNQCANSAHTVVHLNTPNDWFQMTISCHFFQLHYNTIPASGQECNAVSCHFILLHIYPSLLKIKVSKMMFKKD